MESLLLFGRYRPRAELLIRKSCISISEKVPESLTGVPNCAARGQSAQPRSDRKGVDIAQQIVDAGKAVEVGFSERVTAGFGSLRKPVNPSYTLLHMLIAIVSVSLLIWRALGRRSRSSVCLIVNFSVDFQACLRRLLYCP